MRKSIIAWSVFGVMACASSGLAAMILPEDDANWRGTTRYNNYTNGTTTWFGLFTKGNGTSDRAYAEFLADTTTATSASLKLWNFWGAPQGKTVNFNVRIRGIGEDEAGYVQWTDTAGPAPSGTAHESWTLVGYTFDITSLYNANLGKRITFSIRAISGTGDGPIFEDKENTGGSGNAPQIVWVPEPASLLMLLGASGLLFARRRPA